MFCESSHYFERLSNSQITATVWNIDDKTSKLISIVKNNELMSVFLTLDTPTFANHDFQVALGADLVPLTDHPKYIEYLPSNLYRAMLVIA